ncbi:MAG: hypothetical protein M0R77_20360 [Gammaproteobacteria bacterium]|nr:hypothetical protein [Gammaproteobacteria bacterium]
MGKRLSDTQYIKKCMTMGGNKNFIRQSTWLSASHKKHEREKISEILRWLDIVCIQPYYANREYEQGPNGVLAEKVVFYFLDEQDKATFTLCYGELFSKEL